MKKEKNKFRTSTTTFEENEKIIKQATIYIIVHSIIVVGLIIAFIYCKMNGL